MAHTVGVPKRDPCGKCRLPVFLMERMVIGGRVYHRTCLKCARCKSQLTLGNFYETEVDEQYCCETCPDEDSMTESTLLRPTTFARAETPGAEETTESIEDFDNFSRLSSRNSVRERLAFFERHLESAAAATTATTTTSSTTSSSSLRKEGYKDEGRGSEDVAIAVEPAQFVEEELSPAPTTTAPSTTTNVIEEEVNLKAIGKEDQESEPESCGEEETPPNVNDEEQLQEKESEEEQEEAELEVGDNADSKNETDSVNKTTEENLNIVQRRLGLFDPAFAPAPAAALALPISEANEQQDSTAAAPPPPQTTEEDDLDRKSDKIIQETEEEESLELKENQEEGEETNTNATMVQNSTQIDNKDQPELQFESTVNTTTIVKENEQEERGEEKDVEIITVTTETSDAIETLNDETPASSTENRNTINHSEGSTEKEQEELSFSGQSKVDVVGNQQQETIPEHKRNPIDEYPKDLDPFVSDDEEEEPEQKRKDMKKLNPFDSSDDEIELEKPRVKQRSPKSAPPRPPPPRILSKNPFESEESDHEQEAGQSVARAAAPPKAPVPRPRTIRAQPKEVSGSPIPTPRVSTTTSTHQEQASTAIEHPGNRRASDAQLSLSNTSYSFEQSLPRNCEFRASNNSLHSVNDSTLRLKKTRRAPLPPQSPMCSAASSISVAGASSIHVRELFPSTETISERSSMASTPSSSTVGTPKISRKKRPAPAPPKPPRADAGMAEERKKDSKLSDEEKALLEGKRNNMRQSSTPKDSTETNDNHHLSFNQSTNGNGRSTKRLIPLDEELLEEHGQSDDLKEHNQRLNGSSGTATTVIDNNEAEELNNIVYRRCVMLLPEVLEANYNTHEDQMAMMVNCHGGERQLEKLKDNKEAKNRNRQSQISAISSGTDDYDNTLPLYNKSMQGKWKRRKGPAPSLPIPPRRILQMLPLQEIKHELEIIEVQQQGLEKQGVVLEKMIRDRCEGQKSKTEDAQDRDGGDEVTISSSKDSATASSDTTDGVVVCSDEVSNSKEVEYLILQLFELVNEKNELFRRQAELMYLRRQHRLEQEQADLEYEIRVLMAQPERNKTDTDKAREEILIERLVEVVSLRNQVIECLEMDRLREAEEDLSIKQRLEMHLAQRDKDRDLEMAARKLSQTKLSKKEKQRQREAKKLSKTQKIDADKDADESQLPLSGTAAAAVTGDKSKSKKKRKLFIF